MAHGGHAGSPPRPRTPRPPRRNMGSLDQCGAVFALEIVRAGGHRAGVAFLGQHAVLCFERPGPLLVVPKRFEPVLKIVDQRLDHLFHGVAEQGSRGGCGRCSAGGRGRAGES